MRLTWMHRVLLGTSRKYGRNIKARCIGLTSNLTKRKDLSSIKHDRTQSSFTTRFQLIVSRKQLWWNLEKLYTRRFLRHLDLLLWRQLDERIGFRSCWRWNSQQTQPKTKNPVVRTGRLVFGRATIRFECSGNRKRVLLGCESTNEGIGRPVFQLCASVC